MISQKMHEISETGRIEDIRLALLRLCKELVLKFDQISNKGGRYETH